MQDEEWTTYIPVTLLTVLVLLSLGNTFVLWEKRNEVIMKIQRFLALSLLVVLVQAGKKKNRGKSKNSPKRVANLLRGR